jgi:hypothetical protein
MADSPREPPSAMVWLFCCVTGGFECLGSLPLLSIPNWLRCTANSED